jgi:class 3 adenylate cyclase
MPKITKTVVRRYAKYIFLDVVAFSKRSAETQSHIIIQLNKSIRKSLRKCSVPEDDNCILIATGDGACIALLDATLAYDIHIRIALKLLELLADYNDSTIDDAHQFQIRIGINQNTDIVINDINGRQNVAGAGITGAARIMDIADGGQILVSQSVFEELQPTEKYNGNFRTFLAQIKHGVTLRVYQYVATGRKGLNEQIPAAFDAFKDRNSQLNETVAYYLAYLIKHEPFIRDHVAEHSFHYFLSAALWRLAANSCKSTDDHISRKHNVNQCAPTLESLLKYFNQQDYELCTFFVLVVVDEVLRPFLHFFDFKKGLSLGTHLFANEDGRKALKDQWPMIWQELGLERVVDVA